ALFNSLDDMIYQCDCRGKILHANSSLATFFNTSTGNVIGKTESILFKSKKSAGADQHVLKQKDKAMFEFEFYNSEETRFVLKAIKSPLMIHNEIKGIVTVIRDVTVEYNLEKERQKDQNILQQAENQTHSGSYEFDAENDVLNVSPNLKRLLNLRTSNSVISFKKLQNHIYSEDRKLFSQKFESCIDHHIDFEMEHRYLRGSNQADYRYGKTVMKAYHDRNEIRFYGTITDNTAIREASLAILDVQETERASISKELHDNVGQKLSAVSMMLNTDNKDLDKIKNLLDISIQDIRNLSRSLNTPILNSGTLEENLNFLIENLPENDRIDAEIKLNGHPVPDFIRGQAYRILQEGINNALKYSNASKIYVCIETDDNTLFMHIKDNGKGFDMDKVKPGNGIHNIRERVKNCSGELRLFSMPDSGTKISIKIPVNYAESTVSR
ncbi:MAG: ATP-binding protein, partial [Cyclobacteriaceae bacterium]